jgi:hypothetical protein
VREGPSGSKHHHHHSSRIAHRAALDFLKVPGFFGPEPAGACLFFLEIVSSHAFQAVHCRSFS